MPRRFEFRDGKSAKFWEISQRGKKTSVCFGRIGSGGQTKEKAYDSAADAKDAAESLIAQKLKKGYREIAGEKGKPAKVKSKTVGAKRSAAQTVIGSVKSIPKGETLTFVGLVDPRSSGGGIKMGRAKQWTFSACLAAWRIDGGPLVRESLDVTASKIGERKLSTLMKQFDKWKVVRFTAQLAKRQTRPHVAVELVKFLGVSRDKQLAEVKQELSQPIEIRDRTFGTIRFDPEACYFSGELTHRGEQLYLWFETESSDEVKEMIKLAKPLWQARTKWFKEFQAILLDEVFENCRDRYDDEDDDEEADRQPLTKKKFLQSLGQPVGLEFRLEEGELEYQMAGYSEELFSDHGVSATGTLKDGFIDAQED